MSGEDLYAKLVSLGYSDSNLTSCSFDYLFHFDGIVPFLDWICNYIDTSNLLDSSEIKEYNELVSSGSVILEGEKLDEALACFPDFQEDNVTADELRTEITKLQDELKEKDTKIGFYKAGKETFSAECNEINQKRKNLMQLIAEERMKFDEQVRECLDNADQSDTILQELVNSSTRISEFLESCDSTDTSNEVLFTGLESRLKKFQHEEMICNQQIKAYIQKQFFEDIVSVSEVSTNETDQLFFDPNDSGIRFVKGPGTEEYQSYCKEFQRLHSVHLLSEQQLVDARKYEAQSNARLQKLEELMKDAENNTLCTSPSVMCEMRKDLMSKLASTEAQTLSLNKEIPHLIKECVDAKFNRALTTDYTLKLVRQNYFFSKANTVLEFLACQRARTELIVSLLENEQENVQALKNHFEVTNERLTKEKIRIGDSLKLLSSPCLPSGKLIIDSQAVSCITLYHILVDPHHESIPKYSPLSSSAASFISEKCELEKSLAIAHDNYVEWTKSLDKLQVDLKTAVFAESDGPAKSTSRYNQNKDPSKWPILPLTGLSTIVSLLNQVRLNIEQLEGQAKSVIQYSKDKKKVLVCRPLLRRLRRLYIAFYNGNKEELVNLMKKH